MIAEVPTLSQPIVRLGPGECSIIETGARYFATLAFPAKQECKARDDATKAWVAQYLQQINRTDRTDDPFEDPKFNELVALDPAWCKSRLKTVRRRLRDRADLVEPCGRGPANSKVNSIHPSPESLNLRKDRSHCI